MFIQEAKKTFIGGVQQQLVQRNESLPNVMHPSALAVHEAGVSPSEAGVSLTEQWPPDPALHFLRNRNKLKVAKFNMKTRPHGHPHSSSDVVFELRIDRAARDCKDKCVESSVSVPCMGFLSTSELLHM